MTDQLALFDAGPDEHRSPVEDRLALVHRNAAALAERLPGGLHFGTSSWSFPGWAGLVFPARRSQSELAREGLRDYARHPLLTTVGVDRSYYAPVPEDDLRRYADQLPNGFRCCFKAPASVTAIALGPSGRPTPNRDFLSVSRLVDDLLRPLDVAFGDHTGPIILEFPPSPRPMRLQPTDFIRRLDRFLAEVPSGFEFAVELRDAQLLTPVYREVLERHGTAHTYNYWSAMPGPGEQALIVPPEQADFSVVRLLLRPGTWYEDQRERFAPFDRLVDPDEPMRADVVTIAQRGLVRGRRVYVLVNNKAEGSSPLTVMALAQRLADRLDPPATGALRD